MDDRAYAGAWVRAKDEGIFIIETAHITGADIVRDAQVPRLNFTLDAQPRHHQIYGEFGLGRNMAVIFKVININWQSGPRANRYYTQELGIQFAAPKAAIGLLPYGIYSLLTRSFPNTHFKRQKVASFIIGTHHDGSRDKYGAFITTSFADKIAFNDNAVIFGLDYHYGSHESAIHNIIAWEWQSRVNFSTQYFHKRSHIHHYQAYGIEYTLGTKIKSDTWLYIKHGRIHTTGGAAAKDSFSLAVSLPLH